MITSWARKIISIFLLNILIALPSLASERLKGLHIKEQAAKYFSDQGLNLSLLVSDKRTFFPCSGPLNFHQRHNNDWSTVLVRCSTENWETFIRSSNLSAKLVSSGSVSTNDRLTVAVLIKNISKGQVISEEFLGFEARPERQIYGAYTNNSEE